MIFRMKFLFRFARRYKLKISSYTNLRFDIHRSLRILIFFSKYYNNTILRAKAVVRECRENYIGRDVQQDVHGFNDGNRDAQAGI